MNVTLVKNGQILLDISKFAKEITRRHALVTLDVGIVLSALTLCEPDVPVVLSKEVIPKES